jgi:hypothetical protein
LEHIPNEISDDGKYKVRLHESQWRNRISPQLPVTRKQLMVALQKVQAIYIRGTYNPMYRGDSISLRDVSLDISVGNVTDGGNASTAIGVEKCADCPEGYAGKKIIKQIFRFLLQYKTLAERFKTRTIWGFGVFSWPSG